MNRFHFRWKCGREEGTEQIERGKVIEWEKKLREEAKNGRAGEARHWGRACLYCWEEKGILDTNYSCADATPHLMRRVRSYLKDDIKAETEEKKKVWAEQSRLQPRHSHHTLRHLTLHLRRVIVAEMKRNEKRKKRLNVYKAQVIISRLSEQSATVVKVALILSSRRQWEPQRHGAAGWVKPALRLG